MRCEVLAKYLASSAFHIVVFEEHPQFFGSWFAVIETSGRRFRLLYEGRDTRLVLQDSAQDAWNDVVSANIATLSEEQEAQLCAQWLQRFV